MTLPYLRIFRVISSLTLFADTASFLYVVYLKIYIFYFSIEWADTKIIVTLLYTHVRISDYSEPSKISLVFTLLRFFSYRYGQF